MLGADQPGTVEELMCVCASICMNSQGHSLGMNTLTRVFKGHPGWPGGGANTEDGEGTHSFPLLVTLF